MKSKPKKLLRPFLFTVGGALAASEVFFVACMVTLSAPKVKAFRRTNFVPQ